MEPTLRWKEDEERTLAPARMINALFNCPPTPSSAISLPSFIASVLNRRSLQLQQRDVYAALLLLIRLHQLNPHHQAHSGHRLFLVAMMVAHKSDSEWNFSNRSWTEVGRRGMDESLTLEQVNKMEQDLLRYIRWEVVITPELLISVETLLDDQFTRHYHPSPPSSPTLVRSRLSAPPAHAVPSPAVPDVNISPLSPPSSSPGLAPSLTPPMDTPNTLPSSLVGDDSDASAPTSFGPATSSLPSTTDSHSC